MKKSQRNVLIGAGLAGLALVGGVAYYQQRTGGKVLSLASFSPPQQNSVLTVKLIGLPYSSYSVSVQQGLTSQSRTINTGQNARASTEFMVRGPSTVSVSAYELASRTKISESANVESYVGSQVLLDFTNNLAGNVGGTR